MDMGRVIAIQPIYANPTHGWTQPTSMSVLYTKAVGTYYTGLEAEKMAILAVKHGTIVA